MKKIRVPRKYKKQLKRSLAGRLVYGSLLKKIDLDVFKERRFPIELLSDKPVVYVEEIVSWNEVINVK